MTKTKFGKPLCRLIIAVAIMMLSLQAMAYDFSYIHQGKTLYYNTTSDSTVEVTYYVNNNNNDVYVSGDVVIPSTVQDYDGTTYSVTSIGERAFRNCSGLTSVIIPTGVTSIGQSAFYGCSGLTSVSIPNSVTSIGRGAFYGCSGLTSVSIPNSVTSIGENAFNGCSSLTSVTIPTGVTSIGDYAFKNCSGLTTLNFNARNCQYSFSGTSLTTVNIGDSVQRIPANFVRGCNGLTSLTIGIGVTSIGWGAFSGCSGLTTLNFNARNCQDFEAYNNGYYYYPFRGTSLTTVNIGDSVRRIPKNFVKGCNGLTSVTIPTGVTSIGDYAFWGCSGLTSITLPNSLTSIGNSAFVGCSGLTSITIPTGVTSIGENVFEGCSGLTSVTIPNSVTSIGDWAFYGCSSLTSITIPYSVTSIGYDAFRDCSSLTTLNFNAINCQDFEAYYDYNGNDYYPFSGTSLTTVNIGDSVQRIPANFVIVCSGLTSITIPNSVTSIEEYAFKNCSGLTSVTIPNSVTSIGWGAFSGCSGLTSVTIGNSVTSIGSSAFSGCSGLTSVTIPNSVTYIGDWAFYGCSGLTSVTIPNSVTSIGGGAFEDCSGLTSINVASGNTHYSSIDGVLYNYVQDTLIQCPGAKTSVTIPTGVTSIGRLAFYNCSGLTTLNFNARNCQDFEAYYDYDNGNYYYPFSGTSLTTVNIGDSVRRIPKNFVKGCSGLTSLTIGIGVTSIGDYAFSDCSGLTTLNFNARNCQYSFSGTSLTTVNIGDSVQRIPANFVRGCSGLTSVTIGNSVTSIGDSAFYNCSGLTTLNFNARNCQDFEAYRENGNYYYPFSGTSLTTVNIGDSVRRIPKNFVKGCSGLTSLTIGIGVTSIGDYAFSDCSGLTTLNFNARNCQYSFSGTSLTTVNIGDSVQRIPAYFVRGRRGLTSVTIPNSVTSIGEGAFSDCSSLTSITVPNSVTSIGYDAFRDCSGLTTLNFNAINCQDFEAFIDDHDNYYYPFSGTSLTTVNIGDSVRSIPKNFVRDRRGLTSVTIPNSVTSIGSSAFGGCSGLTSVTIGNSVTSIGDSAFSGCSGLTSVTLPNSLTSIGNSAFSGCSGLTSVTLPNNVTVIGDGAFYGCSGLTSVTIPNSVTSIGESAFSDCRGLTTLNFNAINCQNFGAYYYSNRYPFSGTSLTTVDIGDSVQRIPANFVRDCSGLTSVTIPNNVTFIGDTAFRGCSGLTSVILPNSLTSIGSSAFEGCSGLTSVTIPNSVTSIEGSAFSGCSSLTSVTIPNSVTSIGEQAFSGCSGLVSVVIGDGITNIGRNLFGDCPYLTYLTIGRSVESIENGAFLNCSLLSQITSWASVPPEIGGIDAFPHPNNCTVTVPCGSLGAYTEQTNRWNLLFNGRISEGLSFGLSVSANDEAYGRVEVENHSCESKTLTAIANEGYEFTAWNDGNTENPRTVTVMSDTTFMAIFTEAVSTPTITLTVNNEAMGSASYTLDGNTAVLTATANEGYEFTAWNDGNTENPRTVTITSDTAFMAIFTEAVSTPTITLTVNNEAMGSASYTLDGNTAVLTATANEGYEFTGWNDGNTENPRTVSLTSDTAFMAIFTEAVSTPTITLTVNDETMGSATYTLDGNTAVLTATANEGYEFTGWNDGNTENPRTVSLTSDTAFVAIFTEAVSTPTITLTVNNEAMGSASYTLDGNTAVLTATANEGYSFLTWSDGNTENPRTVTITSDTAFMAIFTASGSSSLQEVNAREFALYPNPAKSFVNLEFETLKENTLLQILDLNGRKVRTFDLKAGQEALRIYLGDLPKGVYTIMLGNAAKKLIVE